MSYSAQMPVQVRGQLVGSPTEILLVLFWLGALKRPRLGLS